MDHTTQCAWEEVKEGVGISQCPGTLKYTRLAGQGSTGIHIEVYL